jgi:hypothetical protein
MEAPASEGKPFRRAGAASQQPKRKFNLAGMLTGPQVGAMRRDPPDAGEGIVPCVTLFKTDTQCYFRLDDTYI